MEFEAMEKKLYHACLKGDVEMLEALMREDELTLARISVSSCANQTPLHLTSMLGHFEFAKSLLSYECGFASRLDSQGRSPLHLASANGHSNIVEVLLEYDQKMCRVCDEDGRTPLHLAIMNGRSEAVTKLVKLSPDQEGSSLQFCVFYNRLNVLIPILDSKNRQDLINMKDDNGETILHSATALRRMQMIKYLVKSPTEVDVNVVNKNGLTALDIVEQMHKDVKTMEIRELLISAGGLSAKETKKSVGNPGVNDGVADYNNDGEAGKSKLRKIWKQVKNFTIFQEKKENKDETLLVAASVIAAMAYQAAISPPGGIAGMDATEATENSTSPIGKPYDIGPAYSLLALFEPEISNAFWIFNTIAFLASLSVIFIFVSGATLKRRIFVWLVRAAMWITLSTMTFAYACAVKAITPEDDNWNKDTFVAVELGLFIWIGLISLSIFVLVCRSIRYVVRKKTATNKTNTREVAASFGTENHNIV